LSRREWSCRELRDRLLADGGDPAGVDTAIERLVANGTLDDARVARAHARTAARVKHRGRLRILRELATKGIADDVARAAVDEALPADEAETALERELARRLKPPVDERKVRRVFAALVRLGFAPGDVGRALRRTRGPAPDTEDLG
jgi:regulatory protein